MRIVIIRDWRNLIAGREMEVADGFGNELIRRNIAQLAPKVESAMKNMNGHRTMMLDRKPKTRG